MSDSSRYLDVVVPVHPKDFRTLDRTLAAAQARIAGIRNVYVVSAERYRSASSSVRWVTEPERDDFLALGEVRRRWQQECAKLAGRAGWVYQQVLSLGASRYIDGLSSLYLCLNADTIFLRDVRFDFEGARFVYTESPYPEHPPYLEAYRRLTGEEQLRRCFTAHHMLYDQELLAELYAQIERLHGRPWFYAYLDSIDYSQESAINEQDTYASWVISHHPELALHRSLRWADIRYVPSRPAMRCLARDYDFVSAHTYMNQGLAGRVRERAMAAGGSLVRRVPAGRRLLDRREGAQ